MGAVRVCEVCGVPKVLELFAWNGRVFRRTCKECWSKRERARQKSKVHPAKRAAREVEREIREAMDVDPEIARLAAVTSTWDLVARMLEMKGAPATIAAARRWLGRGVQVAEAGGKPRDGKSGREAAKE